MNITKNGVIEYCVGLLAFTMSLAIMLAIGAEASSDDMVAMVSCIICWYSTKFIINEFLKKFVNFIIENWYSITIKFGK